VPAPLSSRTGQLLPSDLMRFAADRLPACPLCSTPARVCSGVPWVCLVAWPAAGLSRAARAGARSGAEKTLMAGWLPAPSPGAGGSTPDLADWPDPEEAPQLGLSSPCQPHRLPPSPRAAHAQHPAGPPRSPNPAQAAAPDRSPPPAPCSAEWPAAPPPPTG